jgi:DNA modification methylase
VLGEVAAGTPVSVEEIDLGVIPASPDWGAPASLFALKVAGESMRDCGIIDGDIVVVRRQPTADDGEIVVATLASETTLKRLCVQPSGAFLLPENPAFSPIAVGEDGVSIHGVVVGLIRGLARRRPRIAQRPVPKPSGSRTALPHSDMEKRTPADFVAEFVEITGLQPAFDDEYQRELERLAAYLSSHGLRPLVERRREFLAHVNWKFRLNREVLGKFYGEAAGAGFTFHYHQKCQIQRAFDLRSQDLLVTVLNERGVPKEVQDRILRHFHPVEEKFTLRHLANECQDPTELRKEKGDRDIEGEIVKAQFSAFMWVSLSQREMHRFFDPKFDDAGYRESFWDQLHSRSPHLFSRDNALHVLRLSADAIKQLKTTEDMRGAVSHLVERLYSSIDNYGFLAVLIEPLKLDDRSIEWEVAADITLFGEKHRQSPLNKAYFRWERVRDETKRHISGLDVEAARFELVNEGFTYRDCFVLSDADNHINRLLLIFQKNERDESPVPCPTCRSANVQGNSYSSLGVRSWECNNVLCPDRSKYNRGKRYAFRGLAMQQAIDDDRNEIPVDSIRRWTRDVITNVSDLEIVEMLVRHYSMHGDAIHVYDWPVFDSGGMGRNTIHHALKLEAQSHSFWNGPLFQRYVCRSATSAAPICNLGDEDFQVLHGDSAEVLRNLPASMFDGAVTSPPYYNARDYAQWPNMYCYLHDMLDINAEVFRTLKPGALYLYNIFDYFDNENTIVFSAMGQRRMVLSAYTVDLFRRIGFELLGNVVWDKGDIEGKRGFNAGNFSPYYQAPFNCWEHVLVFRKPERNGNKHKSNDKHRSDGSQLVGGVLRRQPVIKMVRGENVHGHTAPFPGAIPELLISLMKPKAIVLDPFGGSLTTGRVAERYGVRSVCIERSEEYCRLGLRMREREQTDERTEHGQLALFQA